MLSTSIVGSVVECSPATRAARVRFPDDAKNFDFTWNWTGADDCGRDLFHLGRKTRKYILFLWLNEFIN